MLQCCLLGFFVCLFFQSVSLPSPNLWALKSSDTCTLDLPLSHPHPHQRGANPGVAAVLGAGGALDPPPFHLPLTIADPWVLHFPEHLGKNKVQLMPLWGKKEKCFFQFLASDQLHIKDSCNLSDISADILNLLNLLMIVFFTSSCHISKNLNLTVMTLK